MQATLNALRAHEQDLIYRLNYLVLLAVGFLMWVDAATGAMQYYGLPLGFLSIAYKTPLIMIMLLTVATVSRSYLVIILTFLLLMMIGPLSQFLVRPKPSFLFNDLSLILKVLTPLIAFFYFRLMIKLYPAMSGPLLVRAFWLNFSAVATNLLLGIAGFGYPSYAGGVDGGGIGVNGFYVAGNELGACFLLLFGFVLHYIWNNKAKRYYLLMALATLFAGLSIATKTAMLASFLLVFSIPLFNERENLFRLTKLKLAVFIPMLIGAGITAFFIVELLQAIGLYQKFVWIVQEKGVLTLVLSGRDEFAKQVLDGFRIMADTYHYITGIGTSGISEIYSSKYKAEVDPVDIFVVFGFIGCFVCLASLTVLNAGAFKSLTKGNHFAPVIVTVNLILLVLIFVSGHILYSGMLGILWGMLNSMAFLKPQTEVKG